MGHHLSVVALRCVHSRSGALCVMMPLIAMQLLWFAVSLALVSVNLAMSMSLCDMNHSCMHMVYIGLLTV